MKTAAYGSAKSIGLVGVLAVLWVGTGYADEGQVGDVTVDGLTVVKADRHTEVQVREDVDWSGYTSYQMLPTQVAFRKNWQRDYNRKERDLMMQVSSKDMERIKTDLAKLVDEGFDEALQDKGGLKKVAEADASTLVFKPYIVNLDVYAPDLQTAAMTRTYVRSAGSATLLLEVYDAVSGALIARWADAREDPDNGYADWATRVSNRAAAKQMISRWSKRLVEGLDELKNTE